MQCLDMVGTIDEPQDWAFHEQNISANMNGISGFAKGNP